MKTFLLLTGLMLTAAHLTAAEDGLRPVFESRDALRPRGTIDRLVFGRLRQLKIRPARVCSDAVFVRRAYLDVIGTLPTAAEAREFLLDGNRNKRRELIDHLLERDELADYWAMKWCDLLRVKAEFPINMWPNAVQAYHQWIRTSIKQNMPYDQFARELLTASGSNFRVPQVNFYRSTQSRQPEAIAQAVALALLGTRTQKWPAPQRENMAVFFSYIGYKPTDEWKEEIIFFDSEKLAADAAAAGYRQAVFPDGTPVRLAPGQDPRRVFAQWLITPGNPWFARNIVNRIWYWLMGRGIIEPPDDLGPEQPASHPKLLAYLQRQLFVSKYDLRHIYRLILNSKTYQLSSISRSDDSRAPELFASYSLRRLDAEVLIDALCQITGTTEEYSSAIPEPFTFIPDDQRSIALADGSITSSFLEMFGRPPRDTGLASERNNRSTAAQQLHLLNSSHILRKIERGPKLQQLTRASGNRRQTVTMLYLTVLSRFPTPEELATFEQYVRSGQVRGREALVDLVWALINSPEFLYRH